MGAGRRERRAFCFLTLQGASALNLLQWNPHWECFEWNKHNCREEFSKHLAAELIRSDIDFANVVEFSEERSRLPARWKTLQHKCGLDSTTLFYNIDRWRVPPNSASGGKGCMATNDRPYIVQQFIEAPAWGAQRKVVVIGAHYPHTQERASLTAALASVVASTGETSVVFLADTNVNRGVSSEDILTEINAPEGRVLASELHPTCCLNTGFMREMAYDRIITNFGSSITSSIPLDEAPAWAQGEFHKPVKAVIVDSGSTKTSTTTTFTATLTATTTSSSTTASTTTTTTSSATSSTSTVSTVTRTTTTTTTTAMAAVLFVTFSTLSTCSVSAAAIGMLLLGRKLLCRHGKVLHQRSMSSSESTEVMLKKGNVQVHRFEPDEEVPSVEDARGQALDPAATRPARKPEPLPLDQPQPKTAKAAWTRMNQKRPQRNS